MTDAAASPKQPQARRSWQPLLRKIIIGLALCVPGLVVVSIAGVIVLWILAVCGITGQPQLNINPADAPYGFVPASATHVDYFEGGFAPPCAYLNFNVSEKAFRKIAQQQGWPIHPIEDPQRCYQPAELMPNHQRGQVMIDHGLVYDHHHIGADEGFVVYFDRDQSRVYYRRDFR